jgi:signal transduction histidine kinase
LPFSGSLAGRALTESHAIAIDDVQAAPDVVLPRLVSDAAVGALLVAPIATPSEQLGVIEVYSPTPRAFSADDADLLTALAATAAIALQNARLYQDARAAIGLREDFLSAAAHELKTPLTGLLASAQYVVRVLDAEGRVDPTSLRQRLATIDDQAHKLARLVEQLLDVSRLEAGRLRVEMSETDLAALVATVAVAARARTTRHGIRLHGPESVRALVDPFRVEQVVTNLVDNAIKYSPNGGPIDVAVDRVGPDRVEIRVTDRGIGIPAEHRDRIFDRFYQANAGAHYGGLGLGLYISRQIVELHGGSLDVELPDEGGARFIVRLPRVPAPVQTPPG